MVNKIILAHIKYLRYLLRHKWFVFVECAKRGYVWRGICHDCSKFLPSEFLAYANHFYIKNKAKKDATGYQKPVWTGDEAFEKAWLYHQHRNPHHWQYWTTPLGTGVVKKHPIPQEFLVEMLCDWIGAGKAQRTKNSFVSAKEWYSGHRHKILLLPENRRWLEKELGV